MGRDARHLSIAPPRREGGRVSRVRLHLRARRQRAGTRYADRSVADAPRRGSFRRRGSRDQLRDLPRADVAAAERGRTTHFRRRRQQQARRTGLYALRRSLRRLTRVRDAQRARSDPQAIPKHGPRRTADARKSPDPRNACADTGTARGALSLDLEPSTVGTRPTVAVQSRQVRLSRATGRRHDRPRRCDARVECDRETADEIAYALALGRPQLGPA